jgi:protocatechuate 3,4-dioxygenase beta subunit
MLLRAFAVGFICFSFAAFPAAAQQSPATQTSSQGSIEGHTLSMDGQPLRKTNLILRPIPVFNGGRGGGAGAAGASPVQPPTPYGTTSDASGKFSFSGLDPGRYTLMAEHAGYLSTQYGMKRTGAGAQAGNPIINLTAGQHITEINIQLAPEAAISGKVTDEDGDPIAQVRVSAMRKTYIGGARFMNQGGGTTDDNGEYHMTNLMPGRYYLSFAPMRMGMFENTRRAGGDASAPEMGYGTTYYPGSPDLQSAVAVDVAEGEEKNGMNLQIHKVPVYHVRGKVSGDLPAVEPGARPMAGRMQISATPPGSAMFGMNSQMVKPDGTFDISGLTPGTWTISAMRMQGQMQTVGRSTVVISNQDVGDLDLAAKAGVDIAGVVRIVPENATVTPQSSARQGSASQNTGTGQGTAQVARVRTVQLQSDDGFVIGGNVRPAQVQTDGSFKFTGVPPLQFRVDAGVPPGGYLKSATLNGQDALQHAVDMSSGGTLQLVVSMTAAEVDGTVTGADGQPATDAMITITPDPLQPDRRDLYHQARTRSDGGFTIKGLAPGKYRVFAWEEIEQGAFLDPDYMHPFESLGTQISVDDSDKKTVNLQEISKDKAADVNSRAGH